MADLTIEQLEELLQKKRSTVKVDIVPQKKCSFIPIRNPKHPCEKSPTVFYGELGYCSEHSRSVQARKAKQALDERLAKEAVQPEPEVKVEASITEVKSDHEKVVEEASGTGEQISEPKDKKAKEDSDSDADVPSTRGNADLRRPTVVKKSIRRNKWGNFEDPDTHIVFNARTKAAYGVQDHKSGKITTLTQKHIGVCEKYHWKYHVIEEDDESSSGDESGEESGEEGEDDVESSEEEVEEDHEDSQEEPEQEPLEDEEEGEDGEDDSSEDK